MIIIPAKQRRYTEPSRAQDLTAHDLACQWGRASLRLLDDGTALVTGWRGDTEMERVLVDRVGTVTHPSPAEHR